MGFKEVSSATIFCLLLLFCLGCRCLASELVASQAATLNVDASPQSARKIPETLFGIFFEEINHAGAGGIWAELVSNRGMPVILDCTVPFGMNFLERDWTCLFLLCVRCKRIFPI